MKLVIGTAFFAITMAFAGPSVASACPGDDGDKDPSALTCPGGDGDKDPARGYCPGGDGDDDTSLCPCDDDKDPS